MRIRLISALVALVLAIAGVAMITSYVQGADRRANGEAQTTDVLVVTAPVVAGTPVEELADSLEVKAVPRSVLADDVVTDLDMFAGRAVGVDLVAGEPLLASRLIDPATLTAPETVPVPDDMQEFSVAFGPEQAVGGQIAAGDTVGIYLTGSTEQAEPATQHVFHRVLVTRVQGVAAEQEGAADATPLPEGSIYLTFATTVGDAERIIHAAQRTSLWLSLETEDDTDEGSSLVTDEDLIP